MIRYLKNDEIDRIKWDRCIDKSFNGIIYAYSWYLDVVSEGWQALIEGDYETIMPLPAKRKVGINYLSQPLFTQQLGVFSVSNLSMVKVTKFIESIPSQFRLIEINLNSYNSFCFKVPEYIMNKNYELDLISDYQSIKKSYSTNLQRNLKKAQENKLELRKNINPELIINLFKANRGSELKKMKSRHYQIFSSVIKECISRGKGHTFGVYKNNEILAGATFIYSHGKVIFLFSGLNETGKKNQAMPWLIDGFIKENALRSITLDFEGSNDPGLGRFYKSFGSRECNYFSYRVNNLPALIKMLK